MKTLKDIDSKPIPFEEDIPAEALERIPTFRKLFKSSVGMLIKSNGDQAIDLYQLGLKLKLSEQDISLEDAEFNMLKDACNQNPMNWIAHFLAQVMLKLKESEK